MSKVHIGKKIKEVLKRSGLKVTEFAKSINLTRDGVYKIFPKESIDTEQLESISKALNHDFFGYYSPNSTGIAKENSKDYGYAAKSDLDELTQVVKVLAKEVSKLREEISSKKKAPAKTYTKTKKK